MTTKLSSTQRRVLERMAAGGMLMYWPPRSQWFACLGDGTRIRKATAEALVDRRYAEVLDVDDDLTVIGYVISPAGRAALEVP